MLNITIVAVGKIKESFFQQAISEYEKRIKKFASLSIIEVAESRLGGESDSEILKALNEESQLILKHLKGKVIVLDRQGKQLSSNDLSQFIEQSSLHSSHVTFVIGSSHGLDKSIVKKADLLLSFSALTFPHQLFRVMLAEQIYRALSISNSSKYHK